MLLELQSEPAETAFDFSGCTTPFPGTAPPRKIRIPVSDSAAQRIFLEQKIDDLRFFQTAGGLWACTFNDTSAKALLHRPHKKPCHFMGLGTTESESLSALYNQVIRHGVRYPGSWIQGSIGYGQLKIPPGKAPPMNHTAADHDPPLPEEALFLNMALLEHVDAVRFLRIADESWICVFENTSRKAALIPEDGSYRALMGAGETREESLRTLYQQVAGHRENFPGSRIRCSVGTGVLKIPTGTGLQPPSYLATLAPRPGPA